MKRALLSLYPVVWLAFFCMSILFVGTASAETTIVFSGGPEGGTFQYFSNGIATRLAKNLDAVTVTNMASAGSLENLDRVDNGKAGFGIAYSGDTYLAREGLLDQSARKYEKVMSLAFLYGAPAHLLTLEGNGISKISDLIGKRIAVGGTGSGAESSARRYFTKIGLWDKMKVEFIGYSRAAAALGNGEIDAMWVFSGYPNSAVIQAATDNRIRIISTWDAGEQSGVFTTFPFYAPVTIPAGTYLGVDYDVRTFQDAALWIANAEVDPDIIYAALKDTFSAEGLEYLAKVKSTARAMSVKGALTNVVTPLHVGASRFWKDQGLQPQAAPSDK